MISHRKILVLAALGTACSVRSATVGKGYEPVLQTLAEPSDELDIVFVVDDSGSMADDQRALVEAARDELFGQLAAQPGGTPDLHVAVVSTSVSVGYGIQNCGESGSPDGAFVLGDRRIAQVPCPGIDGRFLVDLDDGAGGRTRNFAGTLEDTFACVAMIGDAGCGLEHPFEALRRALDGSHPENAGFLRDDAMLLVVLLGDEDDSSAFDESVWDPSRDDRFEINSRGFEHGVRCDPDDDSLGPRDGCVPRDDSAYLTPVADYVDFLRHLKPDPSMVMVAGIVPPAGPVEVVDGISDGTGVDHRSIGPACTPPPGPCAADPTMTCPRTPVPPGIRLDALISQFPARFTLTSLCDQTMPARVRQIARTVSGIMTNQACLVGGVAPGTTTDRCRGFEVDRSGARRPLASCDGGGGGGTCFRIVEDLARCDYAPAHLRASIDGDPIALGDHVEIECLP